MPEDIGRKKEMIDLNHHNPFLQAKIFFLMVGLMSAI